MLLVANPSHESGCRSPIYHRNYRAERIYTRGRERVGDLQTGGINNARTHSSQRRVESSGDMGTEVVLLRYLWLPRERFHQNRNSEHGRGSSGISH